MTSKYENHENFEIFETSFNNLEQLIINNTNHLISKQHFKTVLKTPF